MKPLNSLSPMDFGNKADDGGHLTLDANSLSDLRLKSRKASKFIKRFYGSIVRRVLEKKRWRSKFVVTTLTILLST